MTRSTSLIPANPVCCEAVRNYVSALAQAGLGMAPRGVADDDAAPGAALSLRWEFAEPASAAEAPADWEDEDEADPDGRAPEPVRWAAGYQATLELLASDPEAAAALLARVAGTKSRKGGRAGSATASHRRLARAERRA